MGNTESSPRTPPASEKDEDEYKDPQQQQELGLMQANEETSLLMSPSVLSEDNYASSSSASSPDKMKKKKRQHAMAETQSMINLHREARDLAAICFWVSAFLKRFNSNNNTTTTTTPVIVAQDGYTPEETLHMMLFAQQQDEQQQQQQQQQSSSNNNNNINNHSSHQQQEPSPQQEPPEVVVEISSLQELNAQCQEYMTAHSQPGAPRIINTTSRLRRRQRLIERPMTLLLSSTTTNASISSNYGAVVNDEYNDNNDNNNNAQQQEQELLFYGIVKDDVHQRIVLVFHETPAMMKSSNSRTWLDLLHVHQVHIPLPSTLQGKVPRVPNNNTVNNNNNNDKSASDYFVDSIGLRADIYHFLFSNNNNKHDNDENSNSNNKSRYQTLLASLQHVLRAHPSYTFHVTGFYGRAAACAVMVAFFLAAEPQANLYNHILFNTNPIVNCLAFSCPRVGDACFLQACQYLEKGEPKQQTLDLEGKGDGDCRNSYSSPLLRLGRIVVNDINNNNDNDASAQIPMWNFSHVGFQIRLYLNDKDNSSNSSSKAPEITYPKLVDHWQNRWSRTLGNAISILSFWKQLQQQQSHDSSIRQSAAAAAAAAANYRMAIQQAQGHLQEYKEGLTSLYSSRDKDGSNNWTGF